MTLKQLIAENKIVASENGNRWHAYERFKAALTKHFPHMIYTEYVAAIRAYCDHWKL